MKTLTIDRYDDGTDAVTKLEVGYDDSGIVSRANFTLSGSKRDIEILGGTLPNGDEVEVTDSESDEAQDLAWSFLEGGADRAADEQNAAYHERDW